jgi:hypothetical protein
MTGAVRAGLTIVILSLSLPASAEDPQSYIDRGVQFLDAGHLEDARAAFAQAQQLAPDKANPYRLLGIVDARLGRCTDAVKELTAFIDRVTPGDPRVREAITIRDRCKEELSPKLGTLVVETTPASAEVRLDDANGQVVGTTPYRNDALAVGSHVVYISSSGYKSISRGLSVAQNETVRLELTLEAEPTPAVVEKAPAPPIAVAAPAPQPVGKKRSRKWIAAVVASVVAVAVLGIGLGVGLSPPSTPTGTLGPPIQLR